MSFDNLNYLEKLMGITPQPTTPPRRQLRLADLMYGLGPAAPEPAKPQSQDWIRFKGFFFAGPFPFATAPKYSWSGVYAICAFDATCKPRPYRVVYFGESQNMSERIENHENYAKWVSAAGGRFNLSVAFHIAERAQRCVIEPALIQHYNPVCNQVHNAFRGFARRLSELK